MAISEKQSQGKTEIGNPSVEITDGRAILNNFSVRNRDAVELISELAEYELEQLVESLLSSVAKVAEGTTTAQAVMKEWREKQEKETKETREMIQEKIKKIHKENEEFRENFTEEIEKYVEKIFEENIEDFVEDLAENDDEIKDYNDRIEELIDDKIRPEINELSEKLAVKEKEEEIRDLTSLKGEDFQKAIHKRIREQCDGNGNTSEFTGNTPGTLKRKTGDSVIDYETNSFGDKPRVVLEAKNEDKSGDSQVSKILDEADKAIENREADACAYVFKEKSQIPEDLRPFKVSGRRVIVAVDTVELEVIMEVAHLIAVKYCKQNREDDESINVTEVEKELRKIEGKLETIDEIQRRSNLVKRHNKAVYQESDVLKNEAKKCIRKALAKLE